MQIATTYKKIVFIESIKNVKIQTCTFNLILSFCILMFYIYIDFMFKVQTHVQQFENICKP